MRIPRVSLLMAAGAAGLIAVQAPAQTAPKLDRPLVVELFTSQGCNSCPPADRLLTQLAKSRQDVLPLAFHVTYWNYLGWRDPFSLDASTQRQKDYARKLGTTVYTPQAVVDGSTDLVGSDKSDMQDALRKAAIKADPVVSVTARREGATVVVTIGAGTGAAHVLLVGYDREHQTAVGRGENAGETLTESNIVRSITQIGVWQGRVVTLSHPAPEGERAALLLQAEDGRILGAARVPVQPQS
jgi:hypothetical protein